MNKQAQAARLRDLLGIAALSTNEPASVIEEGMSWESDGRILTLPEPVAYAFLGLVGRLACERPWSEHVSEDYIRDRLVPVVRAARDEGTEAAELLFNELVAEVENYSVERTVYVPIQGLSLSSVGRIEATRPVTSVNAPRE